MTEETKKVTAVRIPVEVTRDGFGAVETFIEKHEGAEFTYMQAQGPVVEPVLSSAKVKGKLV